MPSPFRTNHNLGPNLWQVMPAGDWFSNPGTNSPKVGDTSQGDDGHQYVFVRASATIAAAAAPGTAVTITEPAFTAAPGAGGFNAPVAGVPNGSFFWARKTAL